MDNITLGRRIRYFRKKRKVTQLDLELEVDLSIGLLSRIENGKISPRKETLDKIIKILNIKGREREYLCGELFYPASQQEIQSAIDEVEEYFNKKGVLAYLVDDRSRLCLLSKSFRKAIEANGIDSSKIIGTPLIALAINKDYGIRQFYDTKNYNFALWSSMNRFKNTSAFMFDDPSTTEVNEAIKSDSSATKIWQEVNKPSTPSFHKLNNRKIGLNYKGRTFNMEYSSNSVFDNYRFDVIEYKPTRAVMRVVAKLF
ncbi:helix-turn-helix transcriptional regulator [Candidatus Dojkabacteria bacterium]|nr:helix-turn-helix transcriptional regulator [Candidatus Dojkabacteria bacterium]